MTAMVLLIISFFALSRSIVASNVVVLGLIIVILVVRHASMVALALATVLLIFPLLVRAQLLFTHIRVLGLVPLLLNLGLLLFLLCLRFLFLRFKGLFLLILEHFRIFRGHCRRHVR